MSRAAAAIGGVLPRGIRDAVFQILLFAMAELTYETVRGIADGRASMAFANARAIIDLEKSLGTWFEPGLQAAVLDIRWLVDMANFAYMNTHFAVTAGFLVWLYLRRNESFYFVRNMFLVAMALACVIYALFPVAPPRMFPGEGFVDTINAYSSVNHESALVATFVNPYAAVPSMHMCFALLVAIPAVALVRHPGLRAAWALYPVMVFAVIVMTANHFWVDAAAGAVVAVSAGLVASHVLARAQPLRWAWPAREAIT